MCVFHHQGSGLWYKGSKFHRVLAGQCVQGGDFTNGDGTGGRSIYENTPHGDAWGYFKDESYELGHERGSLSLACQKEPNTNKSQFFVCLKRQANWDGGCCLVVILVGEQFNICTVIQQSLKKILNLTEQRK